MSLAILRDNPMLFKDITQWLRTRTFLLLTFALLLIAESMCLLAYSWGGDIAQPGRYVFVVLFVVLLFYGLIIAFAGKAAATRELLNQTFELYELSGMSVERIVFGKLLSLTCQFLFGLFCTIPFMFFGFYLGGLDFLWLPSAIIILCLLALPTYLLTLLAGLGVRRTLAGGIGRLIGVALPLFMTIFFLMLINVFGDAVFEIFGGMSELLQRAFALDGDVLAGIGFFLIVYGQVCLLVFFITCNVICRPMDSREVSIKILLTTLMATLLLYFIYRLDPGLSAISVSTPAGPRIRSLARFVASVAPDSYRVIASVTGTVTFLLLCATSLAFYFGRFAPQTLPRLRYEQSRGLHRLFLFLFASGGSGFLRFAVFISAMTLGFLEFLRAIASTWTSLDAATLESLRSLIRNYQVLILQFPYFLIVPAMIIAVIPVLRNQAASVRALSAAWWAVTGAFAYSGITVASMHRTQLVPIFEAAGIVLSPITSYLILTGRRDSFWTGEMSLLRAGLGVIGWYVIFRLMFDQYREARKAAGGTDSAPAPDPPAPESESAPQSESPAAPAS